MFGTYLRVLAADSVLGTQREVRVRIRLRSSDGWAGLAFGFQSTSSVLRVLMRPSDGCVVLQRRQNGGAFVALRQGALFDGIPPLDTPFEVRVRFGGGFVQVRILEPLSQTILARKIRTSERVLNSIGSA